MKTAKYLRPLKGNGIVKHYQLSEPLAGHDFVAVSAIRYAGGCETYIFPATASGLWGEKVSLTELEGSLKDTMDHAEALRQAGYEVVKTVVYTPEEVERHHKVATKVLKILKS